MPSRPGDLHNGKLEALQVLSTSGQPITFQSQAGLNAPDQVQLHSYDNQLDTRWVVVHDTATDGTAPFSANDLARATHATPFKRPENGVFRPGSKFTENQPVRWLAEGRDASATIDSANGGFGKNDGDNPTYEVLPS